MSCDKAFGARENELDLIKPDYNFVIQCVIVNS